MALSLTTRICLRNDQAARWAEVNPTLLAGEIGVELDTGLFKIGNGSSAFNELPYANNSSSGGTTVQVTADGKSISYTSGVVSLNNWNKQYYAYDSTTKTYSLQVVDDNHPWVAGLTPRVVDEDGTYVLAWFEPDSSIDNTSLLSQIEGIKVEIGETDSTDTSTLWGAINNKVDASGGTLLGQLIAMDGSEVASKKYVSEQIAQVGTLKRSIVETLPDAADADENTIYMVLRSSSLLNNNYEEYMLVDGAFELIGSTAVDLTDYIQKPTSYVSLNLPAFTEEGKLQDSGIAATDVSSHISDSTIHVNSLQKQKLTNLLPIYALDSSLGFDDNGALKVNSVSSEALPLATRLAAGIVKASDEVTVAEDGTLGIGSISISKLVNDDETEMILFGGNANN